MSPRLQLGLDAVFKAGRLTLRYFQTGTPVDLKADETPVTAADRDAETLIRAEIERAFPGETVLGEEQGLHGAADDRWVIDPIDGTKSFVAGVPLYSTLLSYERAGEPILGICYFPALNEMVYAEAGEGTYLNGRRVQVSKRTEFKGSILACGSVITMDRQGRLPKLLSAVQDSMALRTWGDAYGHALVATGRADAMMDPVVSRWDISAMAVIVREAGGMFTDFKGGQPLAEEALSANPAIHALLLRAFDE